MKTTKRVFSVDRSDINYIRSTIESYDGMAVVKTVDPFKACIEVQISPGCEGLVFELLDFLSKEEGIRINLKDDEQKSLLYRNDGLSDE